MAPLLTAAAHGYNALDRLIRRSEGWVAGAVLGAWPYPGPAVRRRLIQRVLELGFRDFLAEGLRRAEAGRPSWPSDDPAATCGGVIIDTATGRLRPTAGLLARSLAEAFLHAVYAAAAYLAGCLASGGDPRPAALVFGVSPEQAFAAGSDAHFAQFCRRGSIEPLRSAGRVIVGSRQPAASTLPETLAYAPRPLVALHRLSTRPSPGQALAFLVEHARSLAAYLALTARTPAACVLGKDFAYHALAADLDRRGLLSAVVLSHSEEYQQYLWMTDLPGRRFRSHMVWYSNNSRRLVFKADPVVSHWPTLRHIRVDESWLWTEGQAGYLRELGVGGVPRVVGPILWRLGDPGVRPAPDPARAGVRIMAFDVTPMAPDWIKGQGYGHSYYNLASATAFLEDVLWAAGAAGRPASVALKPKRSYQPMHDPRYIAAVEALVSAGRVTLESPDADLRALIAAADLVVVMPFSSPAYVASSLGVPAVYYDPTGELVCNQETAPGVVFAAGREALRQATAAALAAGARRS